MTDYAGLVKTLYSLDMGGIAEHVETLVAKIEELEKEAAIASHAKRLALELECLILDHGDMAAVSKWWITALEALDAYKQECDAQYPPFHGRTEMIDQLCR